MKALIKTKDNSGGVFCFTAFADKYEDLTRRCDSLIDSGVAVESITIKRKKDMIYQRDLSEYGLSTLEEYFSLLIKQIPDNTPMARTMYRDLSAKQKQDFADYISGFYEDDFTVSDILIELENKTGL